MDTNYLQMYADLPLQSPGMTRVISIQPCPDLDAPIEAQMRVIRMNEPYVALSYAWESNVQDRSITCNGYTVPVTASLLAGLQRIRERQTEAKDEEYIIPEVWVDALCINQADPADKTAQISLMGDIYRNSQMLIIWLGERESGFDEQGLPWPRRPTTTFSTTIEDILQEMDCSSGRLPSSQALRRLKARPSAAAQYRKYLTANRAAYEGYETEVGWRSEFIEGILARPWFRRRWVIQEVIQSNVHWQECLYGDLSFTFASVTSELLRTWKRNQAQSSSEAKVDRSKRISRRPIGSPRTLSDIEVVQARAQSRGAAQLLAALGKQSYRTGEGTSATLMQNLFTFRHADCALDHDRVYALLSISEDKENFPVSYNVDFTGLCQTLAQHYVSTDLDLVLVSAILTDHNMAPTGQRLPSWVPDWRFPRQDVHVEDRRYWPDRLLRPPFYRGPQPTVSFTKEGMLALDGWTIPWCDTHGSCEEPQTYWPASVPCDKCENNATALRTLFDEKEATERHELSDHSAASSVSMLLLQGSDFVYGLRRCDSRASNIPDISCFSLISALEAPSQYRITDYRGRPNRETEAVYIA